MGSLKIRIFFIPFIFGIFLLSGKNVYWTAVPVLFIIIFSLYNKNNNSRGGEEIQTIGELAIALIGALGIASYFSPISAAFWLIILALAYVFDYVCQNANKPGVY